MYTTRIIIKHPYLGWTNAAARTVAEAKGSEGEWCDRSEIKLAAACWGGGVVILLKKKQNIKALCFVLLDFNYIAHLLAKQ